MSDRRECWADRLLTLGLILASIGICISIPLVYAGYAVCGVGALLIPRRLVPFLVGSGWALALSIWIVVCGWHSPYRNEAIPPAWTFCWPALPIWALAASHPGRAWKAWLGMATSAILTGMLAMLQFTCGFRPDLPPFRLGHGGERWTQSSGFYSHWIRYGDAQAFATVWLVALLHSLQRRAFWRWAGIALVGVLGTASVAVSGSRGAIMALFAGAGVLVVGMLSWRRGLLSLAILVGLFAVTIVLLWPVHGERLMNVVGGHDGRTFIWRTAWETVCLHPWMGVGGFAYDDAATQTVANGFSAAGPEGPRMGNAHNSFLSLLVLYGIPGLILWLGWMTSIVRHLWRLRHRHPAVWPLGLATVGVFLVGSLTEDLAAYATSRFQLLFGLALALGCTAFSPGGASHDESKPIAN